MTEIDPSQNPTAILFVVVLVVVAAVVAVLWLRSRR